MDDSSHPAGSGPAIAPRSAAADSAAGAPADSDAGAAPGVAPDNPEHADPAYFDDCHTAADEAASAANGGFLPVPLRYRHDGWTPDRQIAFIEALADCGCVDQAARAVGMSRVTAYALRRRADAQAFRLAWDAALDAAVAQLADSALARAIHGVPVPIYYQGELIGERRQFNDRLAMFLLRYRDPVRYGRWRDRVEVRQHQDGPVLTFALRLLRLMRVAWDAFDAAFDGRPAPDPDPEPVDPGDEASLARRAGQWGRAQAL